MNSADGRPNGVKCAGCGRGVRAAVFRFVMADGYDLDEYDLCASCTQVIENIGIGTRVEVES